MSLEEQYKTIRRYGKIKDDKNITEFIRIMVIEYENINYFIRLNYGLVKDIHRYYEL